LLTSTRPERLAGFQAEIPKSAASRGWTFACIAILLVAGLTRVAGLPNQLFLHRDDSGIVLWAMELVETGRFDWTLARPGYVAMLASAYRLSGDIAFGTYLSVIAGLASIGVVAAWAWRLFTPPVAILAAAIIAASHLHNFYSRAQQPAMIVVLCMVLASYWYTVPSNRLSRSGVSLRSLAAGVAIGVALTSHPSCVLFPGIFLIYECARGLEQHAWAASARRAVSFLIGLAIPVLIIQAATTWFGRQSGGSTDFFSQFQSAYGYQSAGTNHIIGTADLLYYPLSVLLVEGPLWTVSVGLALVWCGARWIRHRGALKLFMLLSSVGLVAVWSVAGAVGAADHLRVILPAFPAAAVLTSASIWDLTRWVLRHRGMLQPFHAHAVLATLAAATLLLGSIRSLPLIMSATGYSELAPELSRHAPVPVLVSGANDRSWSAPLRRTWGAGAETLVREADAVDAVVLPTGGAPCYLIVAPESDVLAYPGSLNLPEIVTRRYESAERAVGSGPSMRVLSDSVRFPIFRLEGVDTGVQQVESLGRNGVRLPERAHYTELYWLAGGSAPGCRA
jgi:hypothetical protein